MIEITENIKELCDIMEVIKPNYNIKAESFDT